MKCIICITSYKKGGTADLFALFMRDHGEGVSFFQGYGNGAGRPVLSADENNRLLCRWQMAGMQRWQDVGIWKRGNAGRKECSNF